MASSCKIQPKYGRTRLCDQNCGVQNADRQTDGQTGRKIKTEGPKILSNYIFYFKTVMIIGGPIVHQALSDFVKQAA